MSYCPKCRKQTLTYLPWLGQIWDCSNCGYRGPVFIEMTERALLNLLRKIPSGKVTTYKILAEKLKIHPRTVGTMLNKNRWTDKYPCYKVVASDGRLSGYSKGLKEKLKRLKNDGIIVKNGRINLKVFLFEFSN